MLGCPWRIDFSRAAGLVDRVERQGDFDELLAVGRCHEPSAIQDEGRPSSRRSSRAFCVVAVVTLAALLSAQPHHGVFVIGFHCAEHVVSRRELEHDGVGVLHEIDEALIGRRFRHDGIRRCREHEISVALLRRSLFLGDQTERLKESDLRVKPLAVWAVEEERVRILGRETQSLEQLDFLLQPGPPHDLAILVGGDGTRQPAKTLLHCFPPLFNVARAIGSIFDRNDSGK